jgi:hypothetical protein
METSLPTYQDMQALVSFLPRLPYPVYHPIVEEFYRLVASPCWLDHGYNPEDAALMLQDEQFVKSASLG